MNKKATNENEVKYAEVKANSDETPLMHEDIQRGEGEHEGIGIRESGHGVFYHLKLCVLFLLRGMQVRGDVSMTSEYKRLNPFDDIVIMSDIGGCKAYHLIQLKHAQTREKPKKITSKDLLQEKSNNWKDQFTLQKYFKGYLEIKNMPEFGTARTNFMVFTNIDINQEELEEQCISIIPWEDPHLTELIRESKGKCYKLKTNGKCRVYDALVKGIDNISEDDVKRFIEDFMFAVNLPDETALGDILKKEIGVIFNCVNTDLLKSELQDKLMEWLKQRTGCWLTREDANKCTKDLRDAINSLASRGLDISGELSESGILVIEERLSLTTKILENFLQSEDQLLQIITENSYLTLLKIYQIIFTGKLANNGKRIQKKEVIFTRFKSFLSKESREYVLSAMKPTTGYKLLVIHIESNDKESENVFRYLYKMSEICTVKNKKMLLITEKEIDVSELEEENSDLKSRNAVDDSVTFIQLTPHTQCSLLSRNIVTFLGSQEKTNLAALINEGSTETDSKSNELMEIIDSDTLVHLIKQKEIKIGNAVQEIPVYSKVYLERKLENEETKEIMTEEELLQGEEKVVIIHAEAWMGKGTLLNSLLRKLRLDPRLWVCRVNLNNYAKLFEEELESKRIFDRHPIEETIDFFVENLLESMPDTKLGTSFEKRLFKLALKGYMNVMLVFDELDQICPNYKEVVTSLLISLMGTKVKKLYVTSRPEGKSRRIELDNALYLNIIPLSENEQSKFLIDYWAQDLGLVNEQELKILKDIIFNIKQKVRLTLLENPLNLFLFANYYKSAVTDSYIKINDHSDDYSKKQWYPPHSKQDETDLINFIVRKRFEIYEKDKSKLCVGNISSHNKNIFFMNEMQKFHTNLALEAFFGQNSADHLKKKIEPTDDHYLKVELPKVGLVYETTEGYNFIDSAFTEYYVGLPPQETHIETHGSQSTEEESAHGC